MVVVAVRRVQRGRTVADFQPSAATADRRDFQVAAAKNVLFHVFDVVLLGLKLFQAWQQYPARAVSFSPDTAQPSAFLRKMH